MITKIYPCFLLALTTPRYTQCRATSRAGEFFESYTPPPQAIAILSPSVSNYRDIWTTPAKKELQIKKGP